MANGESGGGGYLRHRPGGPPDPQETTRGGREMGATEDHRPGHRRPDARLREKRERNNVSQREGREERERVWEVVPGW